MHFFGLLVVDIEQIEAISIVQWQCEKNSEKLLLGKGNKGNIEIKFTQQQIYHGSIGQFPTPVEAIILQVEEPDKLVEMLIPKVKLSIAS